ncbi:MAG: META domain-containing protein [Pseudoruegeria sp.]
MIRAISLMILGLSACQSDETLTAYGAADTVWQLAEVNDQPFPARATITFPEEGKISGQGPCNTYSGTQSVPYPWFKAEGIAATRMACEDLEAEGSFFAMLMSATLVEIGGDVMILSNETGLKMIFEAQPD